MKTNIFSVFSFLITVTLLLAGCDKEEDNGPDKNITNTFKTMYPDASGVEWKQKGNFYVVDFYSAGKEKEAWFNIHGTWVQTLTDLSYNDLPEIIKREIMTGDYSNWKVEDVNYLERKGFEPVYVIAIEKGEADAYLYYIEEGLFIKAFTGAFDVSSYPNSVSAVSDIIKFVENKYKDSKVGNVEIGTSRIEVDFIYKGTLWKMYLNRDLEWIETSTDILWADVPLAVKKGLIENDLVFDEKSGKVKELILPVLEKEEDEKGKEVVIESEVIIYQIQLNASSSMTVYFTEEGKVWEEK